MNEIFGALLSDPIALTRNALRIIHFIGLACGIGAATLLDLIAIRFFIGKTITPAAFDIFKFGSSIVSFGIGVLWWSGFAFLLFYAAFDPIKLTNEKVWAKMLIVLVLTINGMIVHRTVLPLLQKQIGKSAFEGLTMAQRRKLVTVGTISVVSWYAPLIIANLSSLNFTVPAVQILLAYAVILLIVLVVANVGLAIKFAPDSDNTKVSPAYEPGTLKDSKSRMIPLVRTR